MTIITHYEKIMGLQEASFVLYLNLALLCRKMAWQWRHIVTSWPTDEFSFIYIWRYLERIRFVQICFKHLLIWLNTLIQSCRPYILKHFTVLLESDLCLPSPSPPPMQCWLWTIQAKGILPTLYMGEGGLRKMKSCLPTSKNFVNAGIFFGVSRFYGQDCVNLTVVWMLVSYTGINCFQPNAAHTMYIGCFLRWVLLLGHRWI